ncbi:zinc finger protein 354A-like [Dermacentor silvarum]|uniref:zinc finger protein 354A-like n=1 Tax=Dermacentor silvarum TaxID=543639 RepID=UPI0018998119|nr:zinc finger protein 354A-like [Dermacentor silvarum]
MHEGEPPTLDWPLDESPRKELSVSLQSMANLEKSFTKERPRSAASSVGESVCPVCSREFKMRCHMVVHLRSAHGVDPATFLDMPQSRNRQGLQKGRAKHTTSRVKAVHKRHRELARKAAAERAAQHQLPKAAAAVATVGTVSKASTPKAKKPKPGGSAQQPSSSQQVTGGSSSKAALSCQCCGRVFDSLRGLLKHEQVHHQVQAVNKPLYKCFRCGSIYKYFGGLVRHRLTCTKAATKPKAPGAEAYKCNKCGAVFDNQVSLSRHMGSHTRKARAASGSQVPCQCNLQSCKVCRWHEKASGDVADNSDAGSFYRCYLCPRVFCTKEKMTNHLIRKHITIPN